MSGSEYAPQNCSVSDLVRLDWMEDHPDEAIRVLTEDRDSVITSHMLWTRIDEAMQKSNAQVQPEKTRKRL